LARSERQDRDLRILAWWRSNDTFRNEPESKSSGVTCENELWRKNLKTLADILSKDQQDMLLKAEVLRELGEFESAKNILSEISSPNLAEIVTQFKKLCDEEDACVRELHF